MDFVLDESTEVMFFPFSETVSFSRSDSGLRWNTVEKME